MNTLTPTLNESQLKKNIDALQKQGIGNDQIQAYVNNYSKASDGTYTLGKQQTSQPDAGVGFNPVAPAAPGDTAIGAGLKAVANTPQSAFNFGKGLVNMFNPINTINTVSKLPGAFNEALQANKGNVVDTLVNTAKELPGAAYKGLVPKGIQQLIGGDVSGAGKTFTNDPFGQAAPVVLTALGGAKALDEFGNGNFKADYNQAVNNPEATGTPQGVYSKALDTAISKTGQAVMAPAKAVGGFIGDTAAATTRGLASHLTGLEPETITQVLSSPQEFTKVAMDEASRGGLAGRMASNIEQFIQDSRETGKAYEPIKANTDTVITVPQTDVNGVPNTLIDSVLKNDRNGFTIEPNTQGGQNVNGTIVADTNSLTRNPADLKAIQNFYNQWGGKQTLTPKEFLNMRADLADLSRFDQAKSPASADVGRQLYSTFNENLRPQVEGLQELDATKSEQIKQMQQLKKDLIQSDSEGGYRLKDGAVNKIANATGKGKEMLLGRLEEIMPGVTKQIQILKAVEDIQKASGIKVGTYTKSALEAAGGGAALFLHSLPVAVATLAGAIITHPSIAVPLIRGAGLSAEQLGGLIQTLKTVGGDINNFKVPANISAGMSVQDVNKMTPEQIQSAGLTDAVAKGQQNLSTSLPSNAPTGESTLASNAGDMANKSSNIPVNNKSNSIPQASSQSPKNATIHPEDAKVMENYIDYVRLGKAAKSMDLNLETDAARIAEHYGLKMPKTRAGLANVFDDALARIRQGSTMKVGGTPQYLKDKSGKFIGSKPTTKTVPR